MKQKNSSQLKFCIKCKSVRRFETRTVLMDQMQIADSSSSSITLFTDTDSYPPLAMEAGLCFFEIGSIDDERLRVSEVTNELHQIVDGENSYQRQISDDACLTEEVGT